MLFGQKVSTGIWSNLGLQVCGQKKTLRTVTGPWLDRVRKSRKHPVFIYIQKENQKIGNLTVTGPWRDCDGTVTARFWNSKLAVLCTMPSPSSRLSNGGGNMIPKKCRHDLKTTATSWRQWTFDQGLFQNIQVGSSHSIMSFVLHCTSRARKDWLQYGVLGLGREWNLLWRASRTQWPNAYIMPLPFRRKANETLVAQVFVPLSHVFFQELRYTNSFISFALKHGLCSRTQGLARHSDMYLTM